MCETTTYVWHVATQTHGMQIRSLAQQLQAASATNSSLQAQLSAVADATHGRDSDVAQLRGERDKLRRVLTARDETVKEQADRIAAMAQAHKELQGQCAEMGVLLQESRAMVRCP